MTYFLYFILGASLGSFIGLVCDRFPEQSIIAPRSHCFSCQKTLQIRDLLPIISQILSNFRCRYCRTAIPKRYFFIEIASGLFVLAFFLGFLSMAELLLLFLSLCLSIYDLESQTFPLTIWIIGTLPLMFLGIINSWLTLFLSLALFAYCYNVKIGEGDFLYLASLSFIFTGQDLLYIIEIACLLGISFALIFKEKRLPFVPFLSVAALIVLTIEKIAVH
ncbi:prepilin peptidase [Streptococcus dentiloxodontae]